MDSIKTFIVDNIIIISFSINFIGLMITLTKFTNEQKHANQLKENQNKRNEYKLKIYQSLLDDTLTFSGIIDLLKNNNPLDNIDNIEVKLCLYEMLVERTLVSYEDGTYSSNTYGESYDEDDI